MNLKNVASKIERILNGNDTEVGSLSLSYSKDFWFKVETTGFHLDHIMDKGVGSNFIPVFISSMGGNMNPVPDLKQGNYVVPIVFYFPVRFKNEIFKLYDYLVGAFVGRILCYADMDDKEPYDSDSEYDKGDLVSYQGKAYECLVNDTTGTFNSTKWQELDRCVSNLSVPTYGEIQGLDLKEFVTWVENKYQEQIEDVNQPFISMQVNLYLTNAGNEYLYGNDVNINLTLDETVGEGETPASEDIIFAEGSLQSISQALSEQVKGENETKAVPTTTTTGFSFAGYVRNNDFYNKIITAWFNGTSQELRFDATITLGSFTYTAYAFIESVNMPIRKGDLLTVTFSLARAIDYRANEGE